MSRYFFLPEKLQQAGEGSGGCSMYKHARMCTHTCAEEDRHSRFVPLHPTAQARAHTHTHSHIHIHALTQIDMQDQCYPTPLKSPLKRQVCGPCL